MRPSSLFAFLSPLVAAAQADSTPFQASAQYDAAEFGVSPRIHAVSRPDLYAPRVNVLLNSSLCSTAHAPAREYVFLAPRGSQAISSPIILDDAGELIWAGGHGHGVVYDLKPQRLFGQDVLTYWSGDDMVRGHGSGIYHVLDNSYNEINTYIAGNGLDGDLHEFLILEENNTALLTVYHVESADLSTIGGPVDAEIWESIFQEIDLSTNEVLFEWHARQHYNFQDSYRTRGDSEAGAVGDPFDWFHINSVAKDTAGNYLISSRYAHSLTYIDGSTGETRWVLGGKRNDFTDLSEGRATTFAGQHDARWHENDAVITIFDNGADYDTHDATYSRGVKLAVNQEAMTVELVAEYVSTAAILSESQGSMQILTNGNALVGYGAVGAYTEFAPDGRPLCEVHFEAESAFHSIDVMSYRVFKKPWRAWPQTTPDAVLHDNDLYVSWNGATEVRRWVVKIGVDKEQTAAYEEVVRVQSQGFETQIPLKRDELYGRYIRILALDEKDSMLGATGVLDLGEHADNFRRPNAAANTDSSGQSSTFLIGPVCVVAFGVIATGLLCKRVIERRSGLKQQQGYTLLPQRRPIGFD